MKIPTGIRFYAIVTQYAILFVFLTYGGYRLGKYLSDEVFLQGLLGLLGAFIGLILFVYNIHKAQRISEDLNGKKDKKTRD